MFYRIVSSHIFHYQTSQEIHEKYTKTQKIKKMVGLDTSSALPRPFANLRFALRLGSSTLACSRIKDLLANFQFAQLRSSTSSPTRLR